MTANLLMIMLRAIPRLWFEDFPSAFNVNRQIINGGLILTNFTPFLQRCCQINTIFLPQHRLPHICKPHFECKPYFEPQAAIIKEPNSEDWSRPKKADTLFLFMTMTTKDYPSSRVVLCEQVPQLHIEAWTTVFSYAHHHGSGKCTNACCYQT